MSTSRDEPPAADPPDQTPSATSSQSAPAAPAAESKSADGLPEVEPLTPEIVEDEALRGDFMLRAFVLVLAVLLAATEIAETTTLVHVKTGQYLVAHGWLPPEGDVFSLTAQGREWINPGWLFDLALAGLFAVGGAAGLTLLKVAVVGVTFFLITRCVRPGVSTWWGSVAAALTLLACHPYFTALPEVVTLLGLAVVLWVLHRWRAADANRRLLWGLVPAFLLWSNLDNHMFLGLGLLLLYAVGDLLGSLLGTDGPGRSEQRRQLWLVLAACVVAACINPFGWQTLTEPLRLYGVEYPALRTNYELSTSAVHLQYRSLLDLSVVQRPHIVAGLVLLAAALVSLVLNRRHLDGGHALALIGFGLLPLLASHELAAAAVVACVVATLNGQDWYRENFSQEYSVEFRERMFSSGGRAVTVLAMFAIAFLAASGRLKDPADRRIGLGFHPQLQTTIDGLRADLKETFDDRAFNFTLSQGDLLIWLGQQPFIDSRLSLYAGQGRDNLLAIHRKTRQSLRRRMEGRPFTGRDEVWKRVLDRFGINRAMPRLSGESPDYITFFSLQPPDWVMTHLGSMTAAVYRADLREENAALDEFLSERRINPLDEAFKQEVEPLEPRATWPEAPSAYQRFLSSPRDVWPAAVQLAHHYDRYLQEFRNRRTGQITVPFPLAAATAHLAIRHANKGLADDPDCAPAFEILGNAYGFLNSLEAAVSGQGNYDGDRRYRQTIAAYSQAALLEPDRSSVQARLFGVYSQQQKYDLAIRALRRYDELTDFETEASDLLQAQQTDILEMQNRLEREVESRLQQIDTELNKGAADMFRISQFAYGQGCVLRALELLELDATLISQRPDIQLYYALLLHEAGRVEEAAGHLESLEGMAANVGLPPGWQRPASWAKLANGNYEGAIATMQAWNDSLTTRQLKPLTVAMALTGPTLAWTPFQSQAIARGYSAIRTQSARIDFEVGLSQLEAGLLDEAAESFRKAVRSDPTTRRPVAEIYYFLLTGEQVTLPPALDRIPLDPADMFAPEETAPGS